MDSIQVLRSVQENTYVFLRGTLSAERKGYAQIWFITLERPPPAFSRPEILGFKCSKRLGQIFPYVVPVVTPWSRMEPPTQTQHGEVPWKCIERKDKGSVRDWMLF